MPGTQPCSRAKSAPRFEQEPKFRRLDMHRHADDLVGKGDFSLAVYKQPARRPRAIWVRCPGACRGRPAVRSAEEYGCRLAPLSLICARSCRHARGFAGAGGRRICRIGRLNLLLTISAHNSSWSGCYSEPDAPGIENVATQCRALPIAPARRWDPLDRPPHQLSVWLVITRKWQLQTTCGDGGVLSRSAFHSE